MPVGTLCAATKSNLFAGGVSIEDLSCTICRSIFVEPVLLPCGHGFCLNCFHGVVKFNALTCPCCRKRFGNWLRNANRNKTLVNETLWTYIQNNFRGELEKENRQPRAGRQLAGKRTTAAAAVSQSQSTGATSTRANTRTTCSAAIGAETAAGPKPIIPQISQPGEIRKEYEAQLENFQKELRKERENELKATSEFIVQLFEAELKTFQNGVQETSRPSSALNETMLVANPGHTPYAVNSTKNPKNLTTLQSETKKNVVIGPPSLVHANSTLKSTTSSTSSLHRNKPGTTASNSTTAQSSLSSATAALLAQSSKCNLIKTLAVRLNRGTDLLKDTVHKAIISKIPQNLLPGRSGREVLTVPPTSTHRAPSRNTNSTDSLKLEMCHFKPIRTVPTTPSKKCTQESVRTPKVKRLVKPQTDAYAGRSIELKPSSLQKVLLKSPRKSAFYLFRESSSKRNGTGSVSEASSLKAAHTHRPVSPADSNSIAEHVKTEIIRHNPVVFLKRLDTKRSKARRNPRTKSKARNCTDPTISRRNGIVKNRKNRCKQRKEQDVHDKNDVECASTMEQMIREQKRCEDMIEQEKRDFELAKKLQAELNVESARPSERKNLRKRKPRDPDPCGERSPRATQQNSIQAEASTSSKRSRQTCKRIVAFEEKTDATKVAKSKMKATRKTVAEKTQQNFNSTSLRRSSRTVKPTRKYLY